MQMVTQFSLTKDYIAWYKKVNEPTSFQQKEF